MFFRKEENCVVTIFTKATSLITLKKQNCFVKSSNASYSIYVYPLETF